MSQVGSATRKHHHVRTDGAAGSAGKAQGTTASATATESKGWAGSAAAKKTATKTAQDAVRAKAKDLGLPVDKATGKPTDAAVKAYVHDHLGGWVHDAAKKGSTPEAMRKDLDGWLGRVSQQRQAATQTAIDEVTRANAAAKAAGKPPLTTDPKAYVEKNYQGFINDAAKKLENAARLHPDLDPAKATATVMDELRKAVRQQLAYETLRLPDDADDTQSDAWAAGAAKRPWVAPNGRRIPWRDAAHIQNHAGAWRPGEFGNAMHLQPAPSQQVRDWIQQAIDALKAAGVPGAENLDPRIIWQIIQHESSGDPNAVNNWDSNAAAGHPSKGLMQCIQSTFDGNHVNGTSNNIMDPVANIAAGVQYALRRYGSLENVPGIKAMAAGGAYQGY